MAASAKRILAGHGDEPYTYLAWSVSVLADGHKSGDRFQAKNYLRGSLSTAIELAELALDRDPHVALCHAHRAFLHLISGDLSAAQHEIAEARERKGNGFHTVLYSAVLEAQLAGSERAYSLLVEAEEMAHRPHHPSMVNRVRARVARADGDSALEERLHLENIEMKPASALALGSYADFLMRARRVGEALSHYERATALQPYPAAVRGLEKARLRMRLARPRAHRTAIPSELASGAKRD